EAINPPARASYELEPPIHADQAVADIAELVEVPDAPLPNAKINVERSPLVKSIDTELSLDATKPVSDIERARVQLAAEVSKEKADEEPAVGDSEPEPQSVTRSRQPEVNSPRLTKLEIGEVRTSSSPNNGAILAREERSANRITGERLAAEDRNRTPL